MEIGESTQMKNKTVSDKCRRVWSRKEEDALVIALKDLCSTGWKYKNSAFRAGYTLLLEKTMLEAFPGTDLRATPHIESKIKVWKRQYYSIASMMANGKFGWNDQSNTLDASDQSWDDYLKRHGNIKALNLRHKCFPHFKDWKQIFGKARGGNELALTPDRAKTLEEVKNEPAEDDHEDHDGFDYIEPSTSVTEGDENMQQQKRQKRSSSDEMSNGLLEISRVFQAFREDMTEKIGLLVERIGYDQDLSKARREVNGQLKTIPSLELDDRLKAASLIASKPHRVDLFLSLDHELDKAQYVRLLLKGIV